METTYTYKLQGDGRDSWIVEEFDDRGELENKYMVYENPIKLNWKGLRLNLYNSPLFIRAITEANPNAYFTLLKVITDGEIDNAFEETFLAIFNMLGMTFNDSEKAEINGYLIENNFTIRII